MKKENHKNHWKTWNKMAISTYLSIITLNGNGINVLIKRHRLHDWIKKTWNKLLVRDSLQGKRHTQTESDDMEKHISWKWKQESRGSNTHIRQNRL